MPETKKQEEKRIRDLIISNIVMMRRYLTWISRKLIRDDYKPEDLDEGEDFLNQLAEGLERTKVLLGRLKDLRKEVE